MVNTFLPYGDFEKIAKVLDNKRLGKQRVEAKQILNIITGKTDSKAWLHHPAVLQWRNYANALKLYINEMIKEWIHRGFRNNMPFETVKGKCVIPWFVNCKVVNYSHQASLLRKNHAHYSKFFKVPKIFMKYSYVWATHDKKEISEILSTHHCIAIKKYAKLLE
jgi:hypothetical protein